MSKKRADTSNKRTAETRANAIRAAPEEEDGLRAYTIIGAAKLEQRAAVWARLGVTYYDETGYPFSDPMLTHEPIDTDIQYNLTLAGVPNGSVVKFWLDVQSSDNETWDQLFIFDTTSEQQPLFRSTGTAGLVDLSLVGLVPAPGPPSKKHLHPKK